MITWMGSSACSGSLFLLVETLEELQIFLFFLLVCGRSELQQTYRAWTLSRCDRALGQELKGGALLGLSCCPGKTRIK